MEGDLPHAQVEHPDGAPVPARPDFASDVLVRHAVVGLPHLDAAVAVHRAAGLLEGREEHGRQRQQGVPLALLEAPAHMEPGRAVQALVGDVALPPAQEGVLGRQGVEDAPLQRVALHIADPPLDLALVLGMPRPRGHRDGAAVTAEGGELRRELRVVPVGALHRGAQVVQHQPPGHAAERQERVLDAPDEALRVLSEHRLAVSLAGVREHEAEHPAAPPAAVGPEDRRPQAEVHLRLLARGALHARDAVSAAGRQAADIPLDRVVRSAETMVAAQILEDALRRQTRLDSPHDLVVVRRAPARRNPGGHPGWFCLPNLADPGGHPGWF